MMLRRWIAGALVLGVALLALGTAPREIAHYTAFAIDLNAAPVASPTSTIEISIERWSTDAERDRLVATLREKGADRLLDAIEDQRRVGTIYTPGVVALDLKFARQSVDEEGNSQVVLVTARPIQFWETWTASRTVDYPFTVVELRLPAKGMGEGKLSLATKVTYDADRKRITLERYDDQPVLLKNVRRTR